MAVPQQITPQASKLQPAVTAVHQTPPASVQEFSIRVPKNSRKKFHMMRFNSNLNVDFTKWNQVKMERENNQKEYRGMEEEVPKFGAGSEFGRDAREEARRKKYGIITKKYKPDEQPWILKVGGKTGKKFKGIREGGVSENAGYYVFMNAEDGIIEAYPLQEWYNFQPIQRYKALSAEEAEEEFGRRNKQQNYFSLMMRKRLRPDEELDLDDPDETKGKKKGGGGQKAKELKISDMEEWMDSDDESDSDEDEAKKDDDKEEKKTKNKKNKKEEEAKKKKKKKDSDDEAFEESDDGDEEGRELDYISDSSVSVSDHDEKAKDELKGVAEEDALRKLLTSDEEEEEEKKEGEEGEEDEEEKKKEAESAEAGDATKKKGATNDKEKKKKLLKKKKDSGNPSSPSSSSASKSSDKKDKGTGLRKDLGMDSDLSDSSDSDVGKPKIAKETNSGGSSRSASPSIMDPKRKATSDILGAVSKKVKLESPMAGNNDFGITEDAVRRYLMRKPMTTTELLQKFKSKKTGLSSEQLVNIMTGILKRINPVRQTIKQKMYLSLKAPQAARPAD